MIIKYASYLGLYLCARKKNLTSDSFILSIAIIQGFFLSFEYFFKDIKVSVNDFVLLLIIVFIYYFATFSILYLFKVMDKIESLNTTIKMLEKDKKIKNALFKLTHEIKNPLAVCKGYIDMINLDNKEKSNKYISSNLYKNYLDILIEDNGIGMDEETLKNIKEMFYTTKQNGTGLGVALSNEIIKSHNGELLFTSELNKGTKVIIRLPY